MRSIQKRYGKINVKRLGIGEGRYYQGNKKCRSVENKLVADKQYINARKAEFYFRFRRITVFQTNRERRRNKNYFSCYKINE